MRIYLSFPNFESRRVCLKVSFVVLSYILMMFKFVRAVALSIFGTMSMAGKCSMILFLIIFILRNTRIYVGSLNGYNVMSYIKTFVN